jgi:hypothetical protein
MLRFTHLWHPTINLGELLERGWGRGIQVDIDLQGLPKPIPELLAM